MGAPVQTVLGGGDLRALSDDARSRPRRRANRNVHRMEDPVHRLLNAIEPGSYVRPHRHLEPPKTETVVVVSGGLGLLVFDDGGAVLTTALLRPAPGRFLADLPAGAWHSFVALEPGTVFFETKAGPYAPPAPGDLAPWAPEEGEERAEGLEKYWSGMIRTIHADFTGTRENPCVAT
jgi:cupin fold WbuC family metalloprotein